MSTPFANDAKGLTTYEKVFFASAGTVAIPFPVARTVKAPSIFKDAGTPSFTYQYSATPGSGLATVTFPFTAAAGGWLIVSCTNMSTATRIALAFETS